jgi:hypothetical protein
VRLAIKAAALSVTLASDLAFFIFFPSALPEIYNQIFKILPWSNDLEITIMLSIGLIIAIISSILLVRTITKHIFKSINGETTSD